MSLLAVHAPETRTARSDEKKDGIGYLLHSIMVKPRYCALSLRRLYRCSYRFSAASCRDSLLETAQGDEHANRTTKLE
jgi:hypothetical protein